MADHLYNGSCPDRLQRHARDPECPACTAARHLSVADVQAILADPETVATARVTIGIALGLPEPLRGIDHSVCDITALAVLAAVSRLIGGDHA